MKTEKQTGQLIGGLLLTGMLFGLWNNFGLTIPIYSSGGWLHNGSQMPLLFSGSVLLGLVTSSLMLAVAILAFPILRQSTPSLALGFLLLSTIVFATNAVEQANFLSMRAFSLQYAKHPGLDPLMIEMMRSMVGAGRHGIHYIDKLIGGSSMLVFFLALFRSNLVPRFIPAIGILAAIIQMVGISQVLFMQEMNTMMLGPIALTLLITGLVLLFRGFSPNTTMHSAVQL